MKASTLLGLSERMRRTRPRQLRTPALICSLTVGLATAVFFEFGLRLNATASLPIGLYIVSNAPDAELAEFCPPEPFSTISVRRGYRYRGSCPDGDSPLLKPIVAKTGDVVVTSEEGISVNGKRLMNTSPREHDSKERPLPHFPFGTYHVTQGYVWVASTYHPRSFDSRYFGPISLSSIRERLKPLLVR